MGYPKSFKFPVFFRQFVSYTLSSKHPKKRYESFYPLAVFPSIQETFQLNLGSSVRLRELALGAKKGATWLKGGMRKWK